MKTKESNKVIQLIAAIGPNDELGNQGCLIYDLPEDLRLFKLLTRGSGCVVGRSTYEDTGDLPGRNMYVVSGSYTPEKALFDSVMLNTKTCIMGGASVYKSLIGFCDSMVITHVFEPAEADTVMPAIDWSQWDDGLLLLDRPNFQTKVYRRWMTSI